MGWLSRHLKGKNVDRTPADDSLPPEWTPAAEESRKDGLYNEAPEDEFEEAERFCEANPVDPPRFLASYDVDHIRASGARAWGLVQPSLTRFRGKVLNVDAERKGGKKVVEVITERGCGDTCVLSNFPILGGVYDIQGKEGVYFEVTMLKMEGIVAIGTFIIFKLLFYLFTICILTGTACQPYPAYRFPGWNRLSAGLHLDDFSKFFEDPNGGRPYDGRLSHISPGDTVGCGYEFASGTLFYTLNGERLDAAFRGVYLPRAQYDVYAALGVGGPGENHVLVNFGGDDGEYLFKWKPGREWAWQIDGHVGRLAGSSTEGDELPSYSQVA